jgi:hypothetical protein
MSVITNPVRTPKSGSRAPDAQPAAAPQPESTTDSAQIEARFLNFLVPAVTAAVGYVAPKVAPSVGGAIGGLFGSSKAGTAIGGQVGGFLGGLFGGRGVSDAATEADEELSRAMEQFQLAQVTTHILQAAAPAIVAALQQEVQQRGSRGETGDPDDEALERSWGFLASLVTEQVVKHAPAAVKFATQSLGSVFGSRDVGALDPLVVDTEMTQRFVLPSMSAIISGIQGCLPDLFKLVSGSRSVEEIRNVRDATISWNDVEVTKRLRDGDSIELQPLTPIDNQDEIEIVLELAPHKNWWKGIAILDDAGSTIAEIGVQDRNKVASVRVQARQLLQPGGFLILGKAKAFGVHTGMYRLATAGRDQMRGQRVHFFWYAD